MKVFLDEYSCVLVFGVNKYHEERSEESGRSSDGRALA